MWQGLLAQGISDTTNMWHEDYWRKQDKEWQDDTWQKNRNVQLTTVQDRVKDAKQAGIHPLAALGVNPASNPGGFQMLGLSNRIGQDVSRSVNQMFDRETKEYTRKVRDAQLRKLDAEVELIQSQSDAVSREYNQAPGQPMPNAEKPQQEQGSIPSVGFADLPRGGKSLVPSSAVKERLEDNLVLETLWALRSLVMPNFHENDYKPPKKDIPKYMRDKGYNDYEWRWYNGSYHPVKRKNKKNSSAWDRFKSTFNMSDDRWE